MTILSKIKWIASVVLVFVIVLTTNLIDKDNFNRLKYSVTAIYEYRVVASDIIFEITILMQEKEIALVTSDSTFLNDQNGQVNQDIQQLMGRYGELSLGPEEQEIYTSLNEELAQLSTLEQDYLQAGTGDYKSLFQSIDNVVHNLYQLSKVQLREGEKKMLMSNETMETINLFTQVEIIFLILMAVIVQVIVFYSKKAD